MTAAPGASVGSAASAASVDPAGELPPVLDDDATIATAHRLAASFAPGAGDRDAAGAVPRAELAELGRSGLLAVTVTPELGGPGVGAATLTEAIRILATADASIAQVLQNHFVFVRAVVDHGTAEQRRRLTAPVLAGGRFGNAMSERNTGDRRTSGITTRLTTVPGADHLLLNGRKAYSTGALTAQWIPVLTLDPDDRRVVAFVRRDAPGVEVIDDWTALGQRGTHSGTTVLTDVRVEPDDVLDWPGAQDRPTSEGAFGQIIHVAIDVGIAQAALEHARDFVRTRSRVYVDSPFEKASLDHHVLYEFGQLAVRVRAAAAILRDAADAIDSAGASPTADQAAEASIATAAAKVFAAETAVHVASELFALAGTHATGLQYQLDRFWRDARVHTLHDPNRWKYHHIANWYLNDVPPSGMLI